MENIGAEEVCPKNDYEEIIPGIIRSLNQSKRVIAQPKLGRAYREAQKQRIMGNYRSQERERKKENSSPQREFVVSNSQGWNKEKLS